MKNTQNGFAIGLIIVIVAALAVGGGVAYKKSAVKKNVTATATSTVATSTDTSASGTTTIGAEINGAGNANINAAISGTSTEALKAAILNGGEYKCTFSIKDKKTTSSGEFYIKNKSQIRGDIKTTSAGQSFVGHVVINDGYTYTWTDAMPVGYKFPIKPGTEPTAYIESAAQVSLSGASTTYKCENWKVDPTHFILPIRLTFVEAPTTQPAR